VKGRQPQLRTNEVLGSLLLYALCERFWMLRGAHFAYLKFLVKLFMWCFALRVGDWAVVLSLPHVLL